MDNIEESTQQLQNNELQNDNLSDKDVVKNPVSKKFSSFPLLLLLILIIVIVVLILLIVLGVIHAPYTNNEIQEKVINDIIASSGWSPYTTAVSGERGKCYIYNTFSTNKLIVDELEPLMLVTELPAEFKCDDGFIKALSKIKRTCNLDRCIGYDGLEYSFGETEEYYSNCSNLAKCKDGRSAIIMHYIFTNGVPSMDNTFCVNSDREGNFFVEPCVSIIEPNSTQFLNVDMKKYYTITLLRIRAPNTVMCLGIDGSEIISEDCLEADNEGWNWLFLPQTTDRLNPIIKYPPQIVPLPEGFLIEDLDEVNEDELINYIKTLTSLQTDGYTLYLNDYARCYACESDANPDLCVNQPNCNASTGIVSSYSFSRTFEN